MYANIQDILDVPHTNLPRKILLDEFKHLHAQSGIFEQLDEKPNKLKWLQTIKNTKGRSTKIFTGLMINQCSLWINVNYWEVWEWWEYQQNTIIERFRFLNTKTRIITWTMQNQHDQCRHVHYTNINLKNHI